MGIGTSLGAYFDTNLDHHAGNEYLTNPNSTPDNNELSTNEVMPKPEEEPKVLPISDIKTASPLVTITDEDIDKAMGLGMSFSGGGLSTTRKGVTEMRRGANDNAPDLVNPNMSKVDQLARKLGEAENGKGSWERIGGGGQEHYYKDAIHLLRKDPNKDSFSGAYNPKEPNMIGSKATDDAMDSSWKRMVRGGEIIEQRSKLMDKLRDTGLNDLEKQKLKNLNKEHDQHFGGYSLD